MFCCVELLEPQPYPQSSYPIGSTRRLSVEHSLWSSPLTASQKNAAARSLEVAECSAECSARIFCTRKHSFGWRLGQIFGFPHVSPRSQCFSPLASTGQGCHNGHKHRYPSAVSTFFSPFLFALCILPIRGCDCPPSTEANADSIFGIDLSLGLRRRHQPASAPASKADNSCLTRRAHSHHTRTTRVRMATELGGISCSVLW